MQNDNIILALKAFYGHSKPQNAKHLGKLAALTKGANTGHWKEQTHMLAKQVAQEKYNHAMDLVKLLNKGLLKDPTDPELVGLIEDIDKALASAKKYIRKIGLDFDTHEAEAKVTDIRKKFKAVYDTAYEGFTFDNEDQDPELYEAYNDFRRSIRTNPFSLIREPSK